MEHMEVVWGDVAGGWCGWEGWHKVGVGAGWDVCEAGGGWDVRGGGVQVQVGWDVVGLYVNFDIIWDRFRAISRMFLALFSGHGGLFQPRNCNIAPCYP